MILKRKFFSGNKRIYRNMIVNNLVDKLDKQRIYDYEVVSGVPRDVISIAPEMKGQLLVYIPISLEYTQYDLDDYIRTIAPGVRTQTTLDRNIYILKPTRSLSVDQLAKLVEYVIKLEDFCGIIE